VIPGTGEDVGLRNAQDRLRLLFGTRASLEFDRSNPAVVTTRSFVLSGSAAARRFREARGNSLALRLRVRRMLRRFILVLGLSLSFLLPPLLFLLRLELLLCARMLLN
jgi:hypothetical protein